MKSIETLRAIIQTGDGWVLAVGVGFLLIVGAAFMLLWSWFVCGRYTRALCLIVILGFGLRAYSASDRYLHNWDERYHALVAKNMIEHPLRPTLYENPVLPFDSKDWERNHIWLHKQRFGRRRSVCPFSGLLNWRVV